MDYLLDIFVREHLSKVLEEALLLFLLASFEKENKKCSRTKFAPNGTENVPNGNKIFPNKNCSRSHRKWSKMLQKNTFKLNQSSNNFKCSLVACGLL